MNFYCLVWVATSVILLANKIEGKQLKVCFFCDKFCQAEIGNFKQYFGKIAQVATSKFQNSGIDIDVVINYMQKTKRPVPLLKYSKGKGGTAGLNLANTNFWKYSLNFQTWIDGHGCGIGFLLSSGKDRFWSKCPKVGVATMFGACQKKGTGTLKIFKDPVKMGTLLSHEIGHQLGISHDGAKIDPSFERMKKAMPQTAKIIDPILKNCGPGSGGGFIMKPSPISGTPYPTQYSKCSKAYINFFLQTKNYPVLKQMYVSKCIA